MQNRVLIWTILTAMIITTPAWAAKVYLNGVDITDLKDKNFSKVSAVRIDKSGNVHIDAPQYEVKVLETGHTTATSEQPRGDVNAAGLTEQYFIATQGPAKQVQYKLTVKINGEVRLVIGAKESSVIKEITGWLKKGQNIIQITAEKQMENNVRASTQKSDELKLLIGSGHEDKKIVKIDSLKATFKCNASTTDSFTKEYKINVK